LVELLAGIVLPRRLQTFDHTTEAVDAIIHGFSLSVEETQCDRFHHTISTVSS
jgi:hypothetical protein